jgi:hypothetical protein
MAPICRALLKLLMVAWMAIAAACGAGLVAGAASGNGGASSPAPVVGVGDTRLPLVPADGPAGRQRRLTIANLSTASNEAEVLLRAVVGGQQLVVPQDAVSLRSGAGNATTITFELRTDPIVNLLGDAVRAADVPAELVVVLGGREVGQPLAVLLVRQMEASLEVGTTLALSAIGEARARLRVAGLAEVHPEVEPADLQMTVTTADPERVGFEVTRLCANLSIESDGGGALIVAADVPGNTFSGPARLVVEDPTVAGRSIAVLDVYYQPSVSAALPAQGATSGGSQVRLIGRALAPIRAIGSSVTPAFDDLEILFRKGAPVREVRLGSLIAEESSLDQLAFVMPPSPDGRPGRVDIVLRTTIQLGSKNVEAEVVAGQVFLFGNPQPVFGPRGAVIDRPPVAVAQLQLDNAPASGGAADFAVLFEEGGVARLQLLMAEENGMFTRAGPARRIGNAEELAERIPTDLVAADFDGDGVDDLAILNAGAGTTDAVLHVVSGQPAPLPPLGGVVRIPVPAGMQRGHAADLDGDGISDLVLVREDGAAQLPIVLLARPGPSGPAFAPARTVPVPGFSYQASTVGDVDGDGLEDVVVATGAAVPQVAVAYGDGLGGFNTIAGLRLDSGGTPGVPGYVADAASPLVGIHVVRFDEANGNQNRALALTFAGLPGAGQTPPTVAVVGTGVGRELVQPQSGNVYTAPALPNVLGLSMLADLGATRTLGPGVLEDELVVATSGDNPSAVQLVLLGFDGQRFTPIEGSVRLGAQDLRSISALDYGTAFPAISTQGQPEVGALFVVHESVVDNVRERRLSTMLVFRDESQGQVTLLSPDLGLPVETFVGRAVGGRFRDASTSSDATLDLAIAGLPSNGGTAPHIRLGVNDGFGGFFEPFGEMVQPNLLPSTIAALRGVDDQDWIAFLTADGRVGLWRSVGIAPGTQPPTFLGGDLRSLSPEPTNHGRLLAASSRLEVADLDGDGLEDLAALLVFEGAGTCLEDAMLLAILGDPNATSLEMPLSMPSSTGDVQTVHCRASHLVLADFARSENDTRLELALAVPGPAVAGGSDGNHVRFYRLDPGGAGAAPRWRRSFAPGGAQILVAGNAPTLLAAADFDRNGTQDLVVAAEGDSALQMFLNDGRGALLGSDVVIEAFSESFGSPWPTAPGAQLFLLLGDINGDGNSDVLLTTESTVTVAGVPRLSSAIGYYISTGTGDLAGPAFVSPSRFGDRDARISVDLGDFNGDDVPDLPVAWNTASGSDRNIIVLFGGSR